MPERRNVINFLNDILEAILKAEKFIKGLTFEDFLNDDKTMFATIRAMEIIGEAANHIPDDIRETYPDIPWKNMIGMRNVLIHQYFGISMQILWNTINNRFPTLKTQLQGMLTTETKKLIKDSDNGDLGLPL